MKRSKKTVTKSKKDHALAIVLADWLRNVAKLHRDNEGLPTVMAALRAPLDSPKPREGLPQNAAEWIEGVIGIKRQLDRIGLEILMQTARHPNPAGLMRMVAKELEGKLQTPYDRELSKAYFKAHWATLHSGKADYPTFAECFPETVKKGKKQIVDWDGTRKADSVERYKKVGNSAVTERSLRRVMANHGYNFQADKRGRPRKNSTSL